MTHILNSTGGSKDVDDLKYELEPNDRDKEWLKKEHPLLTLDWLDLIPEPPKNSSQSTRSDLEEIEKETRDVSKEEFDLIMLVDKEPSDLFQPYLKKHNLKYPKELIDKVLDNVYPVWLKLKYHYKRPRPFQLAPHLGYVISVIQTKTHQTPSYPSGHSIEGSIIAEVLSTLYPEHESTFKDFARSVGRARLLQGVHYQTDNEASYIVAEKCWENIKSNIGELNVK